MCIVDVGPAGQRQPTNRGGFELEQAHALIFDALESRLLDSLPLLTLRVYASERERARAEDGQRACIVRAVFERAEVASGHASVPSHYDNFAGKKVTALLRRRLP